MSLNTFMIHVFLNFKVRLVINKEWDNKHLCWGIFLLGTFLGFIADDDII